MGLCLCHCTECKVHFLVDTADRGDSNVSAGTTFYSGKPHPVHSAVS